MAEPIRTTDNRKVFDAILKDLVDLDQSFTTIGVHQKKGSVIHPGNPQAGRRTKKPKATVAEIAFFNEFGTKNIPQRPFIRSTIDTKQRVLNQLSDSLLNQIVAQRISVAKALNSIGFRIQEEIKNRIQTAQGWAVSLKTSTIRGKKGALRGARTPLIDSGRLLRSITFITKVDRG